MVVQKLTLHKLLHRILIKLYHERTSGALTLTYAFPTIACNDFYYQLQYHNANIFVYLRKYY